MAPGEKRDPAEITFWLSCVDGCDSHSFNTTQQTLKEILPGEIRLYAFCATKEDSISTLRPYLEVEAARELIVRVPRRN